MAEIILFEHANFQGRRKSVFGDIPNLNSPTDNDFNDITSSIIVVSGTWECFPDWNYEGTPSRLLTQGFYSSVSSTNNVGIPNDSLSSIKLRAE
jgi:hypothetical protein